MTGFKPFVKPNIIVVGGSFVGTKMVDLLAPMVYETHNIILIEKNSHFQNLFALPRLHSVSGFEHRAFIPFTEQFFQEADATVASGSKTLPSASTRILRGEVTSILPKKVVLKSGEAIPYEYLVLATGTGRTGTASRDKKAGIMACQRHQGRVKKAKRIVVVGGGAFGVQLVSDIKSWPETKDKHVTLVHSHDRLMNRFHSGLHDIVTERFKELDVNVVLGKRVVVPRKGFPNGLGKEFDIELSNGESLKADLVILCTGPMPLSSPLRTLSPSSINPHTKFIRVKPTLQICTSSGAVEYPNVFAIGDVADTGAHKAAKPGYAQAEVVARNIEKMIKRVGGDSRNLELDEYNKNVPGIHLGLGIVSSLSPSRC
ncbi:FAD/NAD(P)-binding domain-containing protein [Dendrothele bispora CBS 962.96]|uniref:FAD/NAD(P)-binding domain-containing protein n=1 Tax=Dendrothele bispora (strain CBS 962.96) TaxID=1314807 RepID=A0A4S8KM41_DENBC|nr:FAD/NAD(P)-binding domain-containing protein [Dendrothele bispora CBS 962.96]